MHITLLQAMCLAGCLLSVLLVEDGLAGRFHFDSLKGKHKMRIAYVVRGKDGSGIFMEMSRKNPCSLFF